MPVREPGGSRAGVLVGLAVVIALLAGGLGSGVTLWYVSQRDVTTSGNPVNLDQVPKRGTSRPEGSVSSIARDLLPSVVSIEAKGAKEQGDTGTGSGFVIEGGYVVTNNHVVALAKDGGEIRVTFNNGKSAAATIVGGDVTSDIAVIRPQNVTGMDPAPLGNSDNVVVGDSVIAIGSPLGLAGTVTSGIVSSLDRPVRAGGQQGETSYINGIQTDAPINPGNSGGPLVNMRGEVVGVNSAIATMGGPLGKSGSIGVGFAIPINQVKRVAEQIINRGYATHPIIGASVQIGYQGGGARIATKSGSGGQPIIVPDGPADKAGLRPGDVITSLDGKPIRSAKELIVEIRSHSVGEKVQLTYRRNSTKRTVTVTLQAAR